MKKAAIILGIWCTLFLAGMMTGKMLSPHYEQREDTENFIEKNSTFWYSGIKPPGQSQIQQQMDTVSEFSAGRFLYTYHASKAKTDTTPNKNFELEPPR